MKTKASLSDMGTAELLDAIAMPAEMAQKYKKISGVEAEKAALLRVSSFEEATNALRARLSPDPDGAKILSVMLDAATMSAKEYAKRGISAEIYVSTMEAFSRFVRERRAGYGDWAFDRWWWTGRQLSLKLFRIGALEYEMCAEDGREVSLHIPSGCDLSAEAVDRSLAAAEAFFRQFFPAFAGVPYVCSSWLLAPALGPLLPPGSRIAAFRERFEIAAAYPDESYKGFLFGNSSLAPEDFPENTTLRRAVKEAVLRGEKLGSARGILKKV